MSDSQHQSINSMRGIPNIKHWVTSQKGAEEVQSVVTTRPKFDAEKQRLIRKSRYIYESMQKLNAASRSKS